MALYKSGFNSDKRLKRIRGGEGGIDLNVSIMISFIHAMTTILTRRGESN